MDKGPTSSMSFPVAGMQNEELDLPYMYFCVALSHGSPFVMVFIALRAKEQ